MNGESGCIELNCDCRCTPVWLAENCLVIEDGQLICQGVVDGKKCGHSISTHRQPLNELIRKISNVFDFEKIEKSFKTLMGVDGVREDFTIDNSYCLLTNKNAHRTNAESQEIATVISAPISQDSAHNERGGTLRNFKLTFLTHPQRITFNAWKFKYWKPNFDVIKATICTFLPDVDITALVIKHSNRLHKLRYVFDSSFKMSQEYHINTKSSTIHLKYKEADNIQPIYQVYLKRLLEDVFPNMYDVLNASNMILKISDECDGSCDVITTLKSDIEEWFKRIKDIVELKRPNDDLRHSICKQPKLQLLGEILSRIFMLGDDLDSIDTFISGCLTDLFLDISFFYCNRVFYLTPRNISIEGFILMTIVRHLCLNTIEFEKMTESAVNISMVNERQDTKKRKLGDLSKDYKGGNDDEEEDEDPDKEHFWSEVDTSTENLAASNELKFPKFISEHKEEDILSNIEFDAKLNNSPYVSFDMIAGISPR